MAMKLRIPPVADEPDPAVETRGVYVEEWIEALPYAHPQTLRRQLHEALFALNRTPLKPSARAGLLALYVRPYEFLAELGRRDGPLHGVAALERHRAEASALSRLAGELSVGYKRVLADCLGRTSLFGRDADTMDAVRPASHLIACSMMHAWHAYLPVSPQPWVELDALYRYALGLGAEQQAGKTVGKSADFGLDVAASYTRSLLCALVDPYRLPLHDVWRVFDMLDGVASRARIGPLRELERNAGIFVITPKHPGHPAVALANIDTASLAADCLLLDANPLLSELQQRLERLRATDDGDASSATVAMLGRLIRALGVPPRRHSPRRDSRGAVNLVTGLGAIHYLLGGATLDSSAHAPIEPAAVVVEDEPQPEPEVRRAYVADPWDLTDRGSSGLGVIRSLRPSTLPAVGELAGVQFIDQDTHGWAVGVLRWLSINDSDDYRAGVQLLGQGAAPATLEDDAGGQDGERLALVLTGGGSDHGSTILLPSGSYRRGGLLGVRTCRGTMQIRMQSLIESAPTFERIGFQVVDRDSV